jgi:hypothetical protein
LDTALDIFSNYRTFNSPRDAEELASLLVDPERERPAVVISTTKSGPIIDPAALAEKLGPSADVYVLGNAGIAFDLEDELPRDTGVYGGAARSYPPGTAWKENTSKAKVRLAYTREEGRTALAMIADDVAAMAAPGPATFVSARTRTSAPAPSAQVTGTVSVLLEPDGVLVKLDDGIARIDTSVLAPGIEPSRLFASGQEVTGTLKDGVLSVTGMHTPADAADHAAHGTVLPALVASEKAVILFPGLSVRHASGAPAGSVVAVRVDLSGRADGKAWKLCTVDEPDSVRDALPFLPGGHPWISMEHVAEALTEPEPAAAKAPEPAPAAQGADVFDALETIRKRFDELHDEVERLEGEIESLTAEPAPVTGPLPTVATDSAELVRARDQIALMTRQRIDMLADKRRAMIDADELAADNIRLTQQITRLREQVRTERARADRARQMTVDITDVAEAAPLFTDPADQFRHEVYLEWAARIPAGSKKELPLAEYDFVNGFLKDVEELQGVDRSKIVAVAVEVLTGLADSMAGRDMHRLRGGNPGASGCIDHPVYGTAWRVALQVKTAAARRMHFWRGTDGKIRFATVGTHDDMGI